MEVEVKVDPKLPVIVKSPEEIFEEEVTATEITNDAFKSKLDELTKAFWAVRHMPNSIDFGILCLDFTQYKS